MENKCEKLQLNYYLKDIEGIVAYVIISMMKNYLSPQTLLFSSRNWKKESF